MYTLQFQFVYFYLYSYNKTNNDQIFNKDFVDFVEQKKIRMGVQNFWQLIESTGRPVNMNKGLEGKILAIGKKSYKFISIDILLSNRYQYMASSSR